MVTYCIALIGVVASNSVGESFKISGSVWVHDIPLIYLPYPYQYMIGIFNPRNETGKDRKYSDHLITFNLHDKK